RCFWFWPIATLPQEFTSAMPPKADEPEPTRMTLRRPDTHWTAPLRVLLSRGGHKVGVGGAKARAVWPQLISWAATYALLLHSFLAAVAFPQSVSVTAGDEAQTFVICAHDIASFVPPSQDTPAGTQDCQIHCLLAGVGGLFAVAPSSVAAGTIE